MQSMWERADDLVREHEKGNSSWLRLAGDGDKAVIVFLGGPFPRLVAFVDGRYLPYTDDMKARGVKSVLRVAFNVVVLPTREVKVFEMSASTYRDVTIARKKHILEANAFEIQRYGTGKDTEYKLLYERPLTSEEQKAFGNLEVSDLEKLYSESNEQAGGGATSGGTYETKVDVNQVQRIVQELKALPRSAIDRFLQQFGVQRVKDLRPDQLDKARAFVAELVKEVTAAASAVEEEVDPFAA